jgi:hypothetical protein
MPCPSHLSLTLHQETIERELLTPFVYALLRSFTSF